jgi:hypothetical protein
VEARMLDHCGRTASCSAAAIPVSMIVGTSRGGVAEMFKRYSLAWVTGSIFLVLFTAHFLTGWNEYLRVQAEHHASIHLSTYAYQFARSTLENWQGEFFSLLYQVFFLTYLYYAGSPLAGGSDQRVEEKLDAILRKIHPDEAEKVIADLEKRFPKA